MVNSPPAKAGGFSGKLCGNPLAWRLEAGSRPEVGPQKHDLCRRNITVENTSAVTAVHSLAERLRPDHAALRAGLRGSAGIDQHDVPTGPCCLVGDVLNELAPRGI